MDAYCMCGDPDEHYATGCQKSKRLRLPVEPPPPPPKSVSCGCETYEDHFIFKLCQRKKNEDH